jgi:hypothetical protein
MKPRPSINLHIEELVLHGFAPGDRHRISEAVQQELTRLLSEQPISPAFSKSSSMDQIDGGEFRIANPAKPAAIGDQIAGAIHGGISR